MQEHIRPVTEGDLPFLWDSLYEALYVPEGGESFPKSILEQKEIAHYLTDWGRKGDLGWVLERGGIPVGAIWCRLFDEVDAGYGYVSSDIPELTMSILPGHRGCGGGSRLLDMAIKQTKKAGHAGLSLSVDPSNPAMRLYERKGFKKVGVEGTSHTMLLQF